MGQTSRHTALGIMVVAAGIAVLGGEIAWPVARAQTIPDLDARVVAMNIPGASAIAQVGTFLSGPPTPFGQCFLPHPILGFSNGDFITTGAVLDPNRILVGSSSNFGAPLAPGVGQEGSFLSIDPSGPDILSVPPDFAMSDAKPQPSAAPFRCSARTVPTFSTASTIPARTLNSTPE